MMSEWKANQTYVNENKWNESMKCMQINDNEWIMLNGIWFDQQLNIVKYISEKNNEQTIEL
jgi:hypothetical protein